MQDDNDDLYSATMRMDIPPDVVEQAAGNKKVGGGPPTVRKVVFRPRGATQREAAATGGQDFQALLQNIYDAALITDTRGNIAKANIRAVQFFGFAASEFTGLNILQLISGATDDLLPTVCQALQNDRFVLMQAYCVQKDGGAFPAEISVNRIRLSSTDYLSFFIRNITLRKEAEEHLKTSDTAMRNAGSGIAITDKAGNLLYCNPAMLRLWNLPEEEVRGCNMRDFLADPPLADDMEVAARDGRLWSRELVLRRHGGDTFFAQVSVAPNVNPDGEFTGMVFSLLDISSLKRAQAVLEDYAQKLQQRNAEMEGDLQMAREVQLAVLPQESPFFPPHAAADRAALRFGRLYHPSGAVGGDFYDILPLSDTKAGVLIADVAGHGVRAALVVATIRGLIEQLGPAAQDPADFFTKVNPIYRTIFARTAEIMFATCLYMVIDITSGRVQCSSAGHLPPFRLRPRDRTVELIDVFHNAQGAGLGLCENQTYRNYEFAIEPGDVILMYTDGLSEAMDSQGRFYDTARMQDCLSENVDRAPQELLAAIMADAQRFSGHAEFEDDVCLLAVEACRVGP